MNVHAYVEKVYVLNQFMKSVKTFRPNNYTPGWVWLPKDTELNQIVCRNRLEFHLPLPLVQP